MRVATIFGTTLALTAGIGVATQLVWAIQLQDGTVYFAQPDPLTRQTTFNSVHEWGATYYFTINVPQQAGEPSKG